MDEPLSALDALTRPTLQDEIERIFLLSHKTVLLITNDVDEGIRLADRIIPLSAGPAATLGEPVIVDLPRPRDRRALNHDPRFKEIRAAVVRSLIQLGPKQRNALRSEAPGTAIDVRTVQVGV
jgi:nitrate/nitrite transport system ATP-binding protein